MADAMVVPLAAYIYIAWYSYVGSKPKGNLFETNEINMIDKLKPMNKQGDFPALHLNELNLFNS